MSNPQTNTVKTEILQGVRQSLPVMPAVAAFGMLFGATAVNNGLEIWEAMLSSLTVHAGASQFVFLELFGIRAPVWSILLAVFAVNFRHVLYSASVGRHMRHFGGVVKYIAFFWLTDPTFGASEQRAEKGLLRIPFYFGFALFLYSNWSLATFAGALFGGLIEDPHALGLDMLLAIYFLTLVMGFRSRANWFPVMAVSGVTSAILFHFMGPPWHISVGALAGIALAAWLGKPLPKQAAEPVE